MIATDYIQWATNYYQHRYDVCEIAWNTYYNTMSSIRSFNRFCDELKKGDVEADEKLFTAYRTWCIDKGNKPSTINQKLIPLLSGIKRVEGNKSLDKLYYDHHPRRYGAAKDDSMTVRYLTDYQLRQLLQYYQSIPEGREKECLELFLFSFHTCGLRVSDIITLEWRHINFQLETLSKMMVKTKGIITLPLSKTALEILLKRKALGRGRRFVFGLLPDSFDITDAAALSQSIDHKNRYIREILNRVGQRLSIPFPLGMHVARHTFAVMALNEADVNVHMISRLLGHSSVSVTEKVYAKFLLSTLSKELRSRLSFSEFSINRRGLESHF